MPFGRGAARLRPACRPGLVPSRALATVMLPAAGAPVCADTLPLPAEPSKPGIALQLSLPRSVESVPSIEVADDNVKRPGLRGEDR